MKLNQNLFKPNKVPRPTSRGMAGFDNSRENIDQHIKTKVADTLELIAQSIQLLKKNAGSVLFLDTDLKISEDNAKFFWDNTDKKLTVGIVTKGFTMGGALSRFHLYGTDTTDYGIIDTGINFPVVDKPPYPTVAVTGAGNVDIGKHYWQVEYYTEWGGTGVNYFGGSPSLTLVDASTVRVTIPVSTDYRVIGRRIYRTKSGGSSPTEYLLVDIPNNTDTYYDDTIPDADMPAGRAYAYLIPNKCVPMFLVDDKVSALIASGATVFGFDAKTAGGGASFGSGAGKNMADTAFNNTLFGNGAGYDLTTGASNVLIGATAGEEIKTGSANVVIGAQANDAGGTGMTSAVLIGKYAGRYVAGNYNIAIGANALSGSVMGNSARNVAIGYSALSGLNNIGNGYNIGIGWSAGATITTGKSNIMIGHNVAPSAVTASSEINIGNTIYGDITKGNIGIDITPTAVLHLKAGTATAGTAPLKLTSGTDLTTPEAGTIEYDGCSFKITNVATQKAIDRTSDVAVSTVTVANTIAETTLWTAGMAANSLRAGNVFKFHADGIISNGDSAQSSNQVTLRIKVGGNTVATLNPSLKKIPVGSHWHIDANATQRTIGIAGTRTVHIDMDIAGATTTVVAVANINTTMNMDVTLTAEWASALLTNTISLYQGFMEYKN